MSIPVPPPNSTPTTRALTVLGFVLTTAVLYLAKDILMPIALAVLISFLMFPLVFWVEKRGVKRVVVVVASVLMLMSLLGGFGYLLVGQFVEFVDNLPNYRTNIVNKIHAVKPDKQSVFKRAEAAFEDISREMESETTSTVATDSSTSGATTTVTKTTGIQVSASIPEAIDPSNTRENAYAALADPKPDNGLKDTPPLLQAITDGPLDGGASKLKAVPVQIVEGPPNSLQTFQDMVGPILTLLGTAGLVILFVIFFLLQREDLRDRIIRLAGQNKVRVTTEALEEAAKRVSRYLLMQLIINVTYGIPVALGLWLIGVPNALLWGAMATILRFIPYVGPWVAAAMPIALSLAVFDNWTMPLLTIGLFVILELVSNNVLEPILYGQSTGVSPVAIIVSAVFWTWLWGAVGLVLATPITVCLVVLGSYIPQLAFLTVILGDEPVLDDDARIYNRLLSGSTDEALEIAEEYLEEHSLPELYDDVLLPALESAETDRSDEMLSVKRYDRIVSCMNELIDSVNDKISHTKNEEAKALRETGVEKPVLEPVAAEIVEQPLPQRNVVCVPVNDQTDEMAAQMLRHLLAGKPYNVLVLTPGTLAGEVVDAIREWKADVIVLSSVPPFAVTHTRYLAKRLSAEFPDAKLYAGLWRGEKTMEKADQRLKVVGVEHIYTSLTEASQHV